MDHTEVLSEKAFRRLVERGEWYRWEGGSRSGWIKLRVLAVYPSHPRALSPSADDAVISVPRILQSTATLDFLGFTEAASAEIFETFQMNSKHPGYVKDMFAYARAHVNIAEYYSRRKDDWASIIEEMGIRPAVRDQILDDRFKELRMTESARFWVLDTIKAKYEFLMALETRILEPLWTFPFASSIGMPPIDDTELDVMKGADTTRLMHTMCHETDRPSQNGIHKLYQLQDVSHSNCEAFWGTLSALHVSKQRELAKHYAEYARVRVREQGHDVVPVGILHITLPKGVLAETVRTSKKRWDRNAARYEDVPTYLDSQAPCSAIIGPIETLNEQNAPEPMRLPSGALATQIGLYGEELFRKINKCCHVWLEFLPDTTEIQEEAESSREEDSEGGVSIGDYSTEGEDLEDELLVQDNVEEQEELDDGVLTNNDSEWLEELEEYIMAPDGFEEPHSRPSPIPAVTPAQAGHPDAPNVELASIPRFATYPGGPMIEVYDHATYLDWLVFSGGGEIVRRDL